MFNFPFFNYPYNYPYYRHYNKYNNQYSNNYIKNYNKAQATSQDKIEENKIEKRENSITNSLEISNTVNSRHVPNTAQDQVIFELLGIKLYLDDLIILGLLFFLYQEHVKDEMLYIILFLLLFA